MIREREDKIKQTIEVSEQIGKQSVNIKSLLAASIKNKAEKVEI